MGGRHRSLGPCRGVLVKAHKHGAPSRTTCTTCTRSHSRIHPSEPGSAALSPLPSSTPERRAAGVPHALRAGVRVGVAGGRRRVHLLPHTRALTRRPAPSPNQGEPGPPPPPAHHPPPARHRFDLREPPTPPSSFSAKGIRVFRDALVFEALVENRRGSGLQPPTRLVGTQFGGRVREVVPVRAKIC